MTAEHATFYSANGEDCLLWEFFGGRRRGTYMDIGAFDGIHFSNSYAFERAGWQGACVEPQPRFFSLLQRNRPRSLCLSCACVGSREVTETEFFCEELGLLSSTRQDPAYEGFVADRHQKRGLVYAGLEKIVVPAATIDDLIARHRPLLDTVDFVSLDVEGTELDVLHGYDVRRHAPTLLIVESNHPDVSARIGAFLAGEHGYHYAGRLVENLFFARSAADVETLRAIRIECAISPQLHPLGERYTTEIIRTGKRIDDTRQNRLTW